MKIKDIASVLTGVYAKSALSGDAVYLQASMFNTCGELTFDIKPNVNLDNSTRRHLLEKGDVLLAAKGANNFAAEYNTLWGPAIASSTFIIIKLMKKSEHAVEPAYITWYLNHPATQAYLKNQAKGSSMPSISKQTVGELDIPVPTLERQQQILHLQGLRDNERKIAQRLDMLREQFIQKQLLIAAQQ